MKLSEDIGRLSLKEFYETHFDDLFNYAKGITNSRDLAKDAVSEVFLYLISAKVDLNYVRNVRAYLLKSVKNSCIKQLSKNPVQMEYLQEDKEYQIAEEINPQHLLIGKELEEFLKRAIGKLSPQCQLVFEMVRLKHKKYEEVAEELGISVNTVRNHLVHATKILRGELDNFYSDKPMFKHSIGFSIIISLLSYMEIFY